MSCTRLFIPVGDEYLEVTEFQDEVIADVIQRGGMILSVHDTDRCRDEMKFYWSGYKNTDEFPKEP